MVQALHVKDLFHQGILRHHIDKLRQFLLRPDIEHVRRQSRKAWLDQILFEPAALR